MGLSDSPLFSTIIATYNRAGLIGATLDSVLAQDETDQEVIVIDDGSTDTTPEILAGYGDRITVITQANGGAAAARNAGIEKARGRYIALIDSDDLWLPWTLTTYRQAIEQHNQPAFIASHTRAFSDSPPTLEQAEAKFTPYDDFYASCADGSWVPLCGATVRADAMRQVGGFANHRHNYEETDLWMRLGAAPGFVRIEQPVCSMRREHDHRVTLDTQRSVAGVLHMIQQEKSGQYPGGAARRRERLTMLTRHVRPLSLRCPRDGWSLYRETFAWHVSLGRLRYLLGFPFLALMGRSS